jgi:hypothetical protein
MTCQDGPARGRGVEAIQKTSMVGKPRLGRQIDTGADVSFA